MTPRCEKQAELGIAVSISQNMSPAQAVSEMVFDPTGVAVIIEALKTSRGIYQRMLTWVINKVTKVIQVIGPDHRLFLGFTDLVGALLGLNSLNICQRLRHHVSGH